MNLADQLQAARAEVARLERIAADEGLLTWPGCCSVPVHKCTRCGDCDYGENGDADEVRRLCKEKRE